MTPSRLVRALFTLLLLIVVPSFASAATTEFRVLFDVDNDDATGCTVNGMDGVDQVLVTQVTDGTPAQVTRVQKQLCVGTVLGAATDIDSPPWSAGWNATTKLLTLETRIPFSAFGPEEMPSSIHAGFDGTRNASVHTSLANADGTPILLPQAPVRRRAIAPARHITLDGNLADWGDIKPIVVGLASNGSSTLRLLKILTWADPNDDHLYFAATAYLGSDYPYADDDIYIREVNQSIAVNAASGVLNNDAIPGGAPLTAQQVSEPTRGTVTLNADGSFTYSPTHPQVVASDEFEYKAVGGGKESNVARVIIKVGDPNENPNGPQDDHYPALEDTPKVVAAAEGVLANDDPTPTVLVASLVSQPTHGTVVLHADGGFTYIPANNYFGPDSFVYAAAKKEGADHGIGGTATVTITVSPENDAPEVGNQSFNVDENSPNNTVVGTVVATDDDGDPLSYFITAGNTGGAFSINASTGQIRVANSAALDFETNPTFSLTVRVEDGSDDDTATITITLNDKSEPPILGAGGNTLNYTENDPPTVINGAITVVDTDSQITGASVAISSNFASGQDILSFTPVGAITGVFSGNTLTLSGSDSPANYQLALRSVRYQNTSDNPTIAPRTITWTATDGTPSNQVFSTINVISVNDEPSFAILSNPPASNEDAGPQTVNGFASSISAGPGETGQTLTFTLTPTGTTGDLAFSAGPAIDASGNLTYTASANTNGTATFNVVLTDSGSNTPPNDNTSSTLSFTITVNAVNDPPTFTLGPNQTVNEDAGLQTVTGFVTAISVGPANESAQTITSFNVTNDNNALFSQQPAIDTAGNLTYQTNANLNGMATVSVTATDSGGATSSPAQTFIITVNAVNDEPSFSISNPPASNEDAGPQTVNGLATAITAGPADESGQTLSFSLTPNGTTGDLAFSSGPAIDPSGNLTYTASPNTNGTATFNVVLTDSGSNTPPNDNTSATLSFTITVNAVNDPPTFTVGANQTVNEDAGLQTVNGFITAISVGPANESAQTITSFNVTNDNNPLFSVQPAIDTAGNLTYTPAANLSGMATVSVTATDSGGAISSPAQTFIITVNSVNDEPAFAILADPPASNEDAGLQTVNGFATSIDAGAPDESGQLLTFTVTPNGSTGDLAFATGPSIDSSGNLTYTAAADTNGTATFNVVLTDSGSNTPPSDNTSATHSFTITVNAVNDPPTFIVGPNQTVNEDAGLQTVNGFITAISVGPANESAQTITSFNVTNDNNGLFSGQPAIDTSGNLTYTPLANASGTATVSVTATDSGGATSSPAQTFTITVNAVNDNPVVVAGGVLGYTENQAPTAIDTGLTVSDIDSPTLTGATVAITGNFAAAEDVLAFADIGPITFVSYTGGVLTLAGTDTVANYQAALRTVTYANTSDNPSTAARTITWQVNDGAGVNNLSAPVTSTVNVTAVNDAPVVDAAPTFPYTEGTGPVVIDNAVLVSDVDDTQLSSATVQITANYVNGEDILAFANAFGITGNFVSATGTLTLTGPASVANFQSALRTVTYQNTSTNPSVAPRTVTWIVNDPAPLASAPDTTTISITAVNSPPAITAGGTLSYTENNPASVIDNTITVSDSDTPNLVGATVQITGNYANGQDVLSYVPALGITGIFTPGTGTLTLTGTTTPANWQTALRNVLYANTSDNPSTAARTVTWQVDDGEAVSNLSNLATSTINVSAVNDPPTINAATTLGYTEDDGAVVIDGAVTVADLDDANLTSATVQITANYVSGEDVLAFTNAFGITGNFVAGTGTLTLTGPASVANFQSALRTVTYQNTSQSPSTATRTVTWTVNDAAPGGTDTTTITVASVNDAPALTITGAIAYNENDPATSVATAANITDADDANIESATIQITGNYQNGEDVLSYATALGITGNFVPATGTLTLTGSATKANYITALQNVKYANTSENPSTLTRTLTWTVNDGDVNSNTANSTVAVTAQNDAPVITRPLTITLNEDQTFAFTGPNTVSVADVDAGAGSLVFTVGPVTFPNGTICVGAPVSNCFTATFSMTLPLASINSALAGMTFTPTANVFGPDTITFQVSDQGNTGAGGAQTDTKSTGVTVNAVNDAPALTVTASPTPTYTENGAPISIATSASIVDVDDANIESATIQITGNYENGADVLSYVTALGITGNFVPATGTLTLTGTSSLANYSTALQNVKFASTSENPSALQRTVTWTVNDGDVNSNSQTTNINVVNVNDPPAVNANDLGYIEDSGAVVIDGSVTVTDPDDALLPSATVQITANYANGQDILAFTNAFGITGNFVAGTGTLTLTGPASPANFQSALRTVTYQNTSNNPSTAPRSVTWTVNDDEPSSGTDTTTITVTATNDAPVLTVTGTLNYTENDPATNVATTVNITDPDDTNIESATIQITGNYQNGQDVLSYVTALGITGNFVPATGTLTLTGSTTLANYITALQNVKYANTSEAPSTLARTVTWIVNDGDNNSNSQTTTVNVTSVNDAPVVTPTGVPLAYTENDPATAVQPLITVSDVDSANLTGATIQITTNYQNGQDVLSYVTALGITGVFAPATGTLTLSGTTTVANYQTALRNVKYNNASENPSHLARTVAWQVNDGAGVNNLSTIVNSTINVTAVNDAPTVLNESFDVLGNTELRVDMVAGTTPNTTKTVNNAGSFQGLIFNDSDVEGDPFTITAIGNGCGDAVAPFDCTLAGGAVVHVDANGEFSYTPAPGATSGSFTYTVTDQPSVGIAQSVVGTVTFNFFEMVWYVKQGSAGNGTSISPYGNMDNLDGIGGAGDVDDNDDYIFVHNSGALALSLSVPLEANQHVLGEGVGLSIPVNLNGNGSPTNLVAAGTRPVLTLAAGDMFAITNAMPIEVRGLNMTATAGNVVALDSSAALTGSSTLTVSTNTIGGNGAEAIDVNMNAGTTGTLNLAIANNDWNVAGTHTGTGIDVVRTAGTLNLNISNNTNVVSAGTGINVNGAVTITGFDSNSVHQNTGGAGVTITNATFDTVPGAPYTTVTGGTMTIGIAGDGVGTSGMTLTTVAGDLGFTDLDIFAGTSAFTLTGTGAANIAAGTGTQVTVGAGVADFRSAGAPAVDVNNATVDLRLSNLQTTNTSTRGVSLVSVSDSTTTAARFSAAAGSITTTGAAAGPIFNVSGGNAGISFAGTISNNGNGRAILVDSLAMDDATDDVSFSGAITESGTGILLNNNSGASRSITFSGGVTTNTSTGEGFGATANTNTGGLNITGTNILSSSAATALRITSTTIGASNVTFRSISSGNGTAAADPASGIILTSTGATGRLIVTGNAGACTSLATCTGGAIRNTTSHGVAMNSTLNPSFTRIAIQNTAGSGIDGTAVAGFTLANSFIDNNGTGGGADESNIAFDVQAAGTETNLSGAVSITGNTLTNARWHGVRILNFNGTISNATITGNTITSATAIASSLGSGIHFQAIGSASTAANVTAASLSNNTITNFPSGAGIVFAGGNANAAGPGTTTGTPGSPTNIISITGNVIEGQSAANPMGVSAVQATVSGANSGSRSQGNFDISNNGTVAVPLRNMLGVAMNIGTNGYATTTVTSNGNRISANNGASSPGLGGGNGIVVSAAETPDMTWTINNNNIANTDGNGILAVGRGGNGILRVKIQNNTVAAPLGGVRPGIRVDAGNGAVGSDDDVCLNISGNTSAGSGGTQGIGLRKQGTSTTVNAFGINGLPGGSTATPALEAYVNSLNPAGGGTLLISATSGFTACSLP
jgi:hypothetical protein